MRPGETSWARRISSSVVDPIAERTPTTFAPDLARCDEPLGDRLSFAGFPTEVPPNFMTTSPGVRTGSPTAGTASNSSIVISETV